MVGFTLDFSSDQFRHRKTDDSEGGDGVYGGNPNAFFDLVGDGLADVVFLLLLDGKSEPNPNWTFAEKVLDGLVQFAQPSPAVTHVELLFPPSSKDKEMHFASYIGAKAGFGSSFHNQRSFYLGENSGQWRAVPITAKKAALRLRTECEKHKDTQYSMLRYVFAVPPLRAIASLLPESVGSPGHCANISAKCLKNALPELGIEHSSNWYAPTTLSLELSSDRHTSRTREALEAITHVRSIGEDENIARAVSMLMHNTDEELKALEPHLVRDAIAALSLRAVGGGLDDVGRRICQRQLATALLRYSCNCR